MEKRRLYRSQNNRIIGGVCGGLSDYFGWDSTLVRVVFAMLVLAGGNGLLLYLLLWILTPLEPAGM